MSPEIVALLVLLGFAAAAFVFTLVVVFVVDRSVANTRADEEGEEGEKDEEQESE
jgi:ammonia channel protein AmtB